MQRRRYYRIAASISPRRVIALDDRANHFNATDFTILDLSGGGLLARVSQNARLGEGDQLRISFVLDGDPIDVNVAVSWVRPLPGSLYEVGCRFEALAPQMQIAILDHIRRNQVRAVG